MSRPPLNPALIDPPPPPTPPVGQRRAESVRGGGEAVSVSELAASIKEALQAGLPRRVRVVGEVSNFSGGTHLFFSLKDAGAAVRCVMFASRARMMGFEMSDGAEVVATGRVEFYDKAGNVQLYVDSLEPVGRGRLEAQLQRLMVELRELGYFASERKRRFPLVPRKVAVVTSRNAAALQDVIDTARRRWRGCRLVLCDVRVQGEAAAGEIAAMIRLLSERGPGLGIDAVIVTRGGGSIEDLWAFNERVVADALFECVLPTAAAIGHETDTTVADLVADARYATPTQAAMGVVPDHGALTHQLDQLGGRLRMLLGRQAAQGRQRVESAAMHRLFRFPQRQVADRRSAVEGLEGRMARALLRVVPPQRERMVRAADRLGTVVAARASRERQRVDALSRGLEAVNPRRVLERGYTYTLGRDGGPLRSAAGVSGGDTLTTVLADGQVRSVVAEAVGGAVGGVVGGAVGGAGVEAPRKPQPRRKRTPNPLPQKSLFTQ